jgi:hypothetical protein
MSLEHCALRVHEFLAKKSITKLDHPSAIYDSFQNVNMP